MKNILLVFCFLFCFDLANSQSPSMKWAKSVGGSSWDYANQMSVDAFGNVYTIGLFVGTSDFDPGLGIYNRSSNGGNDIYILKLDVLGNFVWAKKIGGLGNDLGNSIKLDNVGNLFITGTFSGTVDFDPGAGTYNLTSTGNDDVFISKLDTSGNFSWAKKVGGNSDDVSSSIALDSSLNVYLTGNFQQTVDFDPGTGIYNLTSASQLDIFILKLDTSGNFIWAKRIGGSLEDFGTTITVDKHGYLYCGGCFGSIVDFDPGSGIFNLTAKSNADIFILKLNSTGDFVWAKRIGDTLTDQVNQISLDLSGNLYATGFFEGNVDFDPGSGSYNMTSFGTLDIFCLKLDTAGNLVWAKQMGGPGTDNDNGQSIAIDKFGNVYTAGVFNGTVDFDPGNGIYNLTSSGVGDLFISKLSASGNFIWAKKIGGAGNDFSVSIDVDGLGNIYTTGGYSSTVNFDISGGTNNLTSAGGVDAYVCKITQASFGIKDTEHSPSFSLFPNPFNNSISISINDYDYENTVITIFDNSGKIINTVETTQKQMVLQTNDLAQGIYIVSIVSQNGKKNFKVVKY